MLSINWASIETCKFSQNAMYAYPLYSCFIYRHVKAFFLYWNKLYIFPILGLAKNEYYKGESISNQPNLFPVEIHLFFFDVIAL